MPEEVPAMLAAHRSWSAVHAKDKEGWLALMADDICIEDPIGVSVLDPVGKGQCGKEAVSERATPSQRARSPRISSP
jgi:steroid delta-isomerase